MTEREKSPLAEQWKLLDERDAEAAKEALSR